MVHSDIGDEREHDNQYDVSHAELDEKREGIC